jgi:hypothetical protein
MDAALSGQVISYQKEDLLANGSIFISRQLFQLMIQSLIDAFDL